MAAPHSADTKPFSFTLAACIAFHTLFWVVALFINVYLGGVIGLFLQFVGAFAFLIDAFRARRLDDELAKDSLKVRMIFGVALNNIVVWIIGMEVAQIAMKAFGGAYPR